LGADGERIGCNGTAGGGGAALDPETSASLAKVQNLLDDSQAVCGVAAESRRLLTMFDMGEADTTDLEHSDVIIDHEDVPSELDSAPVMPKSHTGAASHEHDEVVSLPPAEDEQQGAILGEAEIASGLSKCYRCPSICPAGMGCTFPCKDGLRDCRICPAETFSGPGENECQRCPEGKGSSAGSTQCDTLMPGQGTTPPGPLHVFAPPSTGMFPVGAPCTQDPEAAPEAAAAAAAAVEAATSHVQSFKMQMLAATAEAAKTNDLLTLCRAQIKNMTAELMSEVEELNETEQTVEHLQRVEANLTQQVENLTSLSQNLTTQLAGANARAALCTDDMTSILDKADVETFEGLTAKVTLLMASITDYQAREAVLEQAGAQCISHKASLTTRVTEVESQAGEALVAHRRQLNELRVRMMAVEENATDAQADYTACRDSIGAVEDGANASSAANKERLQETMEVMMKLRNASNVSTEVNELTNEIRNLSSGLSKCQMSLANAKAGSKDEEVQASFAPEQCQEKIRAVGAEVAKAKAEQKCALCVTTEYEDLLFDAQRVKQRAEYYAEGVHDEASLITDDAKLQARYILRGAEGQLRQLKNGADADAAYAVLKAKTDADKIRSSAQKEIRDLREDAFLASRKATAAAQRITRNAQAIASEAHADAETASARLKRQAEHILQDAQDEARAIKNQAEAAAARIRLDAQNVALEVKRAAAKEAERIKAEAEQPDSESTLDSAGAFNNRKQTAGLR